MDVKEIAVIPSGPGASEGVRALREHAPKYLQTLIEKLHAVPGLKSLKELEKENIKALSGGNMSVDYAVCADGKWVVVKFRSAGAEAEAEALTAWSNSGADVVGVTAHGKLPDTKSSGDAVKYLVLEAAVNKDNQLAETVKSYLEDHPGETKNVARTMGQVLAKMHQATAGDYFGEFADMWGNKNHGKGFPSWTSYLVGYVDKHKDYLVRLGFSPLKVENLRKAIAALKFTKEGVYLHGDFSERNALLTSHNPYQVKVFDPNPIIGDPSWDLAILYNNHEFAKRKFDHDPEDTEIRKQHQLENELLSGIKEGYQLIHGEEVSTQAIAAAQLMQCLYLLPGKEKKAKKEGKEPADSLEAQVVKDTLFDKVKRLAY